MLERRYPMRRSADLFSIGDFSWIPVWLLLLRFASRFKEAVNSLYTNGYSGVKDDDAKLPT